MFLESICTADEIVESNVREVKVHSPDYKGVEADEVCFNSHCLLSFLIRQSPTSLRG